MSLDRTLVAALGVASLLLTSSAPIGACPGCPVGRSAREQVFQDGFAMNLLVAILPFAVVGLVCMWVERPGRVR
jgi:hypothetical protein